MSQPAPYAQNDLNSRGVPQSGTVIVLNGVSSVGKSSIQCQIQGSFEQPYLAMGFDTLMLRMAPDRYLRRPDPDDRDVFWFDVSTDSHGAPLHALRLGPLGQRFVSGMHHAIAALASRGNNVVVDYAAYEREWLQELADVLSCVTAYFIGLRAPLSVLERRERMRGDRPRGSARAHYDEIHKHALYDLELDTSACSPQECAETIGEHLAARPVPTAFERLRERLGVDKSTADAR